MANSAAAPARPHWSAQVVDGVVAAALLPFVGISAGNALAEQGLDVPALGWLLAFALCAPVAVRRRWPVPALIVTMVALLAAMLLGLVFAAGGGLIGMVPMLVLYSVGRAVPARRAVDAVLATVVALCLLVLVLVVALPGTTALDPFAAAGLVLAELSLAWLVGRAVRERNS